MKRSSYRHLVILLLLLTGTGIPAANAAEYGSYANSMPAFHYMQSKFTCIKVNQTIVWDTISIEVHPRNNATDCGISILKHQNSEIWRSLDGCLNRNDTSFDECHNTSEYGIVFIFDPRKLINNPNLHFPCASDNKEPEILAIHIIYGCADHGDDIMVVPTDLPPLPPLPPNPSIAPPPMASPTMQVVPLETTARPTTGMTTTTTIKIPTTNASKPQETTTHLKPITTSTPTHKNGKNGERVDSHPITARELGVIVGPSVAALVIVIIVAITIFTIYKRKQLKVPSDLQGESLFYSRRFSTASQLSDVSINAQPVRVMP